MSDGSKADIRALMEFVRPVPIADIDHHLFSARSSSLVDAVKSARQRLGTARYSRQLLQLFDPPGGLVVDDIGRAAADRLVKFHHRVGNRSRNTFIFPSTTHQVVVFVVEGREYVV